MNHNHYQLGILKSTLKYIFKLFSKKIYIINNFILLADK